MKFLLALAAFLIAATSVAAAAHGIYAGDAAAGDNVASRHAAQADDLACHGNSDNAPVAPDCDYSAVCAFACGVVAPSLYEPARVCDFTLVEYLLGAADMTGAAKRPEAPPPRSVIL